MGVLSMRPIRRRPGHAFIVGSGIAGLSVGEILARNGWRVTLFEATSDLGGDASRRTQNWFHTGWLYAGLPTTSAMRGCFDAVHLFRNIYGAVLGSEVVNIDASGQGIAYPPSDSGWFSADPVHYIYAISSHELSLWQKLTWRRYLDGVLLRRLRGLGYGTEAAAYIDAGVARLLERWEHDERGRERYRVVPSTDARIHTWRVLSSLLPLLGDGAQAIRNAQYELRRRGDRTSMHIAGEVHTPDLLVLASGKAIPALLGRLGYWEWARRFRTICSPIVVLNRLLDLPSFIRFTPRLQATINHIRYSIRGADVSTVGSYDAYPPDEIPDLTPFVERVCERLAICSADVAGTYCGTKTELVDRRARRYNHAVDAINSNTHFAIAGKFSQFPLLVHDFAQQLGLRTDHAAAPRGRSRLSISCTVPELLVRACETSAAPRSAQG